MHFIAMRNYGTRAKLKLEHAKNEVFFYCKKKFTQLMIEREEVKGIFFTNDLWVQFLAP
jgi:hypothetical protein